MNTLNAWRKTTLLPVSAWKSRTANVPRQTRSFSTSFPRCTSRERRFRYRGIVSHFAAELVATREEAKKRRAELCNDYGLSSGRSMVYSRREFPRCRPTRSTRTRHTAPHRIAYSRRNAMHSRDAFEEAFQTFVPRGTCNRREM